MIIYITNLVIFKVTQFFKVINYFPWTTVFTLVENASNNATYNYNFLIGTVFFYLLVLIPHTFTNCIMLSYHPIKCYSAKYQNLEKFWRITTKEFNIQMDITLQLFLIQPWKVLQNNLLTDTMTYLLSMFDSMSTSQLYVGNMHHFAVKFLLYCGFLQRELKSGNM